MRLKNALAHGRRARPERALHQHGIEPAAEFEADRLQRADVAESKARMQADRRDLRAVADDGDHLPPVAPLAPREIQPSIILVYSGAERPRKRDRSPAAV